MYPELQWHRRHGNGVAMCAQAMEFRLNQTRPLFASCPFHGLLDSRIHFQWIGTVYCYSGDTEGLRFLRQRIARDVIGVLQADVRIGLVIVVFQNVDDRQLPHCAKIQRFEERALLRGAVSKKAVDYLARVFYLRRERRAGRVSDGLTDDS